MKLLRDTTLIYQHSLKHVLRNPVWMIFGLIQPALYLLLYAPLLTGMVPGGNALQLFTPGLLVMMALTGSLFTGFGLLDDLRQGVIERLRVTPAHRLALLLGRVLRDVTILLAQCLILLTLALLMGVRADGLGAALTLLLVALIGGGLSALSYGLALLLKDENALASSVNTVMLPILLLSGIFLPMTFAPPILKTISNLNPLTHAVEAARLLFAGSWNESVVLLGFGLMIVISIVSSWWATRLFRSATA